MKSSRQAKTTDDNALEIAKQILQLAKTYSYSSAKTLLQQNPNADVSVTDNAGKSVLHYVASTGRLDIVSLLLRRKKSLVNHADRDGKTALHVAAMKGHDDVVAELIKHGAFIDCQDAHQGRTPLHMAAERNYSEIVDSLLGCGADVTITDNEGKTPMQLCENKKLNALLNKAFIEARDIKLGRIEIETVRVINSVLGKFGIIGLGVLCDELGERGSFDLTCRKEAKEHASVNFQIKDREELCSDVFTFKLGDLEENIESVEVVLTIPLFWGSRPGEEMVMKCDNQQEVALRDTKRHGMKWTGSATVDLRSFRSFIVVCRRKRDRFKVGQSGMKINPTDDKRFEMDIPENTFSTPGTISVLETEPPEVETIEAELFENIACTTSFYSIETDGCKPDKDVTFKVPLPNGFTGVGQIVVLSRDSEEENEAEGNSWKILDTEARVEGDKIVFSLSSFSVKVAVETKSYDSDSDESILKEHVSRLYKKARRREYVVSFLCLKKREQQTDSFTVLVECCLSVKQTERKQYWLSEGYEDQSHEESKITVQAKQRFKVSINQSLGLFGDVMHQMLEFHPRREKNTGFFSVVINDGTTTATGNVEVETLRKKPYERSSTEENEKWEFLTSTKMEFLRLKNIKKDAKKAIVESDTPARRLISDSKVFLNDTLVAEVLENFKDDEWLRIYVLMGISFEDIENKLWQQGQPYTKMKELLISWRDSRSTDVHQGVPDLLSALFKGGHRFLASTVQIHLKQWFESQKASEPTQFYMWVSKAYHDANILVPAGYPKPMSDPFLVMLADDISPLEEFGSHLSISDSQLSEIMKSDVYSSDCFKSMKILTVFRRNTSDTVAALQKLLNVFEDLLLKDKRQYTIMCLNGWLKRNTKTQDKLYTDVARLVKTMK